MRYVEPVFRPPSEAFSYILQVTIGCAHNECTFCGMYRTKKFRVRPESEVLEDIQKTGEVAPDTTRVFLADGDAMVLSHQKLLTILDALNTSLPHLERVGIYTDAKGINSKTPEELRDLQRNGLGIVYLGLESGSDQVLEKITKGFTSAEAVEAVKKAQAAGIKVSVIALLGVAGQELSSEHTKETAKVIGQMSPDYFSALTLTVVDGTPLSKEIEKGDFQPLTPEQSLKELADILENLRPHKPIIFRTNHASNYLPLKGTLPDDKKRILTNIKWALENKALKPEWQRGL